MRGNNYFSAPVFWGTILLAVAFAFSNITYAQSPGFVTVQSDQPFNNTIKEAKKMVAQNGMMVLSTINQGKILSMTGLSIKATSLFIGNPNIGNKLFGADRGVGIAVPVRLNIYEGKDGKTYVSYIKPSERLSSFKNEKINKIARMLDKKLAMLTGKISK